MYYHKVMNTQYRIPYWITISYTQPFTQSVQQAALAHIWAADQCHAQPAADELAASRAAYKSAKLGTHRVQLLSELFGQCAIRLVCQVLGKINAVRCVY